MGSPGKRELGPYVEEVALLFEEQGIPRMAGRIFGWLLVSESRCQTLDELARAVRGSKASMSTMTRLLVQLKVLGRRRDPGARSDCYFIRPDAWTAMFEDQVRFAAAGRELADRGLSLLAGEPAQRRASLQGFRAGCVWLEREMPRVLEGWRRENSLLPRPALAPEGRRGPAHRVYRR